MNLIILSNHIIIELLKVEENFEISKIN
jgi:hypothetical protein